MEPIYPPGTLVIVRPIAPDDVRIGDPRDRLHPLHELLCQAIGTIEIHILDLHVDRCRQAKIQHLTDDIRGLEIEDASRKLGRQRRPDLADVTNCRMVTTLQGDQNLRIHVADIVARHERQVEGRWHANRVVDGIQLLIRDDFPDRILHFQHQLFGVLDAGAGRRAVMQLDQADVGAGEEIQPDRAGDHPGHERRGREGQQVPARRTEQVSEPREAPVEDRDPHDARG